MSSLEQEVRTLQKQVRRQRRWNIALGALVVVGGLIAATAERSVPEEVISVQYGRYLGADHIVPSLLTNRGNILIWDVRGTHKWTQGYGTPKLGG